jgi:hypothetical protein
LTCPGCCVSIAALEVTPYHRGHETKIRIDPRSSPQLEKQ